MATKKCTIFYTDDDEDDQNFFLAAAAGISNSLKVTTLDDGDDLIHLLGNPPPLPDIIFLDLNMPRKNGFDVLKEIKQSVHTKNFPVIIFSTSDDLVSITKSRQLGASMYMRKPSSINNMKKVISHALSIQWDTFNSNGDNFVFRAT